MSETNWREWLAEQRAASSISVSRIPLADVRGWGMQEDRSRFGRPDGKFFNLMGAKIEVPGPGQREVQSWDQPLVEEVGEGAVVLAIHLNRKRLHYECLVSAKAEPGNDTPGCVLLAPTLQTSASNLEQAHGGKRPPRAELLDGRKVRWVRVLRDGARFYKKWNRYALLDLNGFTGELHPDERWFTFEELKEAFAAGETNEHLAQAFFLWAVLR